MDVEAVRKMLQEVIQQQQVASSWSTYALYALFALIAGLSALLGAYLKKIGETIATRKEFNAVLAKVEATTNLTNEIQRTSAYLESYLKTKGESFATREEFDQVLDQVRKTSRATEEIKTAIARRSDFKLQVISDRYKMIVDCEKKIRAIATYVNRLLKGAQVPSDFIQGEEIVPLTQVQEQISINKFLLGERFYDLLILQSKLLLDMATKQKDPDKVQDSLQELLSKYIQSLTEFDELMDKTFNISEIKSSD
jgi:hypothetical protein